MSARFKNGRTPESVRPNWWEYPTFMTYGNSEKIMVELILPDGSKVKLGQILKPENQDALRQIVGLRFKEIWDPEKFCRRTST